MTTALAMIDHNSPAQVDTALQRLTHLLKSPDDAQPGEVERAVASLSAPAAPEWAMARIAALLHPYYEKTVPDGIRMMEAEDWADALADLPQWAIQRAVQWWKGPSNPDRRKRPLEGDIAARAKVEMEAVSAAQVRLKAGIQPIQIEEAPKPRVSTDEAAKILKDVGFAPKRMGAA